MRPGDLARLFLTYFLVAAAVVVVAWIFLVIAMAPP
jgi:hypothetical protein